jgi:hypothetical protein
MKWSKLTFVSISKSHHETTTYMKGVGDHFFPSW